jgi:hypothetical protein
MARTYLLSMAAGALLALAIVACANWFIDPLQIYQSPRIQGLNALKPAMKTRSRVFKTVVAASGDWQALIVGTSRAETGFDPGHPFFAAARCFNAALSGEAYEESLALVQAAARRGSLRKIVAVLDFEVANAYYEGAPDFIAANYRPWRKESLAMSLDVLGESLGTVRRQDRAELVRDQSLWLADGRYVFPPPISGHRALALVSESEYLGTNFFRGAGLQFELASASTRPTEHVRGLMALSYAKGIELVLVIAPAHARQLETIAAAGLWSHWEEWKRNLVAIRDDEARRSGRTGFPMWDFSGYNDVTTEPFPLLDDMRRMRWYYDSSHFSTEAGNRILDRMSGKEDPGFGILLTAANLDKQLQALRAGRVQWRETHAADVGEIEGLARDAALIRASRREQLER